MARRNSPHNGPNNGHLGSAHTRFERTLNVVTIRLRFQGSVLCETLCYNDANVSRAAVPLLPGEGPTLVGPQGHSYKIGFRL